MPSRSLPPLVPVLAGAALIALLAGCTPAAEPGDAAEDSRRGGSVVVALDNPIICADPQQATAFAAALVGQHVVDQLTYQNPDTGEIEPWLASSWEVNDDSTQFRFVIRDDVTFSDETALTADVVARNIEEIVALGPAGSLGAGYLAGLTDVSADGDTVTFTFDAPNAQFLQATSTTALGIVSETTYDVTPEARCQGELIASGPFTVAEVVLDGPITLDKRADYAWAPASFGHEGAAYLDSIEFVIVPEAGVRTGLLTSGQADAIAGVFAEDEATFTESEDFWLTARATPGFTNSLVVNGRSPLLADGDVRQALQLAIDRTEILDTLASSLASPAIGLLSSTAAFSGDFSEYLTPDVDRANELLDDAGWVAGADGIREKAGQRLSLTVVHFAAQSPLIALVNQQFREVGAELVSEVLDPAQRDDIEAAANFDLLQRNMTRADPDALRNQLGFDYSNYLYRDAPDELDELLTAQAATTDVAARQAIVDEIQTTLLGDARVWPLNELTQVYAGSSAVQGARLDASSRLNLVAAWKEPSS